VIAKDIPPGVPANLGYRIDKRDERVAVVRAQLVISQGSADFSDLAPHLVAKGVLLDTSGGPVVVSLHDVVKNLTGSFLPSQYQNRGTCTSRGLARVLNLLQYAQIKAGKQVTFKEVNHAVIYGLGRETAGMLGGNPNNQNDDGCTGVDVGKGVVNGGDLTYEDTTEDDNRNDDTVACLWGAKGVPQKYKEKARTHLVTGMAACNSFDDVKASILSGRAVTIASGVGYTGNRGGFVRDSNGVCRAGGSWPHQMCFTGYASDIGGLGECLLQDQSWGPDQPSGPIGPIDIPSYSFWVVRKDAERQIRERDCWTFSGLAAWDDLFHWLV
jgi:hypothetical protein